MRFVLVGEGLDDDGELFLASSAALYRDGVLVWSGYSDDVVSIVRAVVGEEVEVRAGRRARGSMEWPATLGWPFVSLEGFVPVTRELWECGRTWKGPKGDRSMKVFRRRRRNDVSDSAGDVVAVALVWAAEGYPLRPGDVVLHSCGGEPRAWLRFEYWAFCTVCHSSLGPDQPFRQPHAYLICGTCHAEVGVCLGFDPGAEAEAVVSAEQLARTVP